MSTAINSYSLSSTPSNSTGSAGSDTRKKISFDDLLLLPSSPSNNYKNNNQNSFSKNYLCYSARVSPVLPPISSGADVQRKYNTAPASPHHHSYLTNNITPATSPLFTRAQLVASYSKPRNFQENLPSLRHLQLLPDPRIQEYASYYPDTSERTPIWKRNLVHWCKENNYQDYTKIVNETSHDRTQLSALLRGSSHDQQSKIKIPSVLKPKDVFQGLSDYSANTTTPMTPPMSPNSEAVSQAQSAIEFTPFVSSKLVQTVKQQSDRSKSSRQTCHKKTNSFKAMQLKKLFNNRDILSNDSKSDCGNRFKVSKPSSSSSSSSSISDSRLIIDSAARKLVISLDGQARRSPSPVRCSELNSSATQDTASKPINSRSRSSSPVRPATPPHTATSSKYHKFALGSPQSPVATVKQPSYQSGSSKTTPKRRRSSGSNPHSTLRKCVSCHSNDSPCWRPSWSGKKHDQLCNSCGLRYKKTHTRCLNRACRKIPTKGELSIMKSNGIIREQNEDGTISEGYRCLFCNRITETTDRVHTHNHT